MVGEGRWKGWVNHEGNKIWVEYSKAISSSLIVELVCFPHTVEILIMDFLTMNKSHYGYNLGENERHPTLYAGKTAKCG